jgi:hypothetical protein
MKGSSFDGGSFVLELTCFVKIGEVIGCAFFGAGSWEVEGF